jgi:hypothetical protein
MILWTASALRSDNSSGRLPSIAPMKINLLKSLVLGNKARCGLALLAFLFSIWFTLTPGAAQSRNQKRITSLLVGEASEGSRVTVVSDAALNDYEAFRRGDRFYVRIPLADFGAGQPGFRGDGFEDVQVQKVGDSVVISFKLQPGATARVDQRSNRLEVIFTVPSKSSRSNRPNLGSNPAYVPTDGIVRVNNSQNVRRLNRDTAGPIPPGSPQVTRERVVTERLRDSQPPRNPAAITNPREDAGRRGNSRPAGNTGAVRSETSSRTSKPETSSRSPKPETSSRTPKPETPSGTNKSETLSNVSKSGPSSTVSRYEPSPSAMPSTSPSYPALAISTPATTVGSQPAVKSPGGNTAQDWKNRGDIALRWVKANRQASLLGGLFLVLLLVVLALLLRRRKNVVKAKRPATTLAQPKPSEVAPNSPVAAAVVSTPASGAEPKYIVNESAARPTVSDASPIASANGPQRRAIQEDAEGGKFIPEPAAARSVPISTPPNRAWVPASASIGSSADEDQEREVFEL